MYDARALRLEVLEEFEEARRSVGLHDELAVERWGAYRLERDRKGSRERMRRMRERRRVERESRRRLAITATVQRAVDDDLPTPLIVDEILASKSSPTRESSLRYAAEAERAARAELGAPRPFQGLWTCPGCGRQLGTKNSAEWCCRRSVPTL